MAYEAALTALSDPTRRLVFERVLAAPQPVGAIADGLPVSRPAVSQHLRVLKQAQLVRDEAVGTRRYYRLDPRGFAALRSYFDKFWDEALESFKAKVEEE